MFAQPRGSGPDQRSRRTQKDGIRESAGNPDTMERPWALAMGGTRSSQLSPRAVQPRLLAGTERLQRCLRTETQTTHTHSCSLAHSLTPLTVAGTAVQ